MNNLTFHAAVEYTDKSGKTIIKEFYAPDDFQSYNECADAAETLVIDLAFEGIKSVFTNTHHFLDDESRWTHYEYEAFDKAQFLKWLTEDEYEWLKTQDHSDTGYCYYERIYKGAREDVEDAKDLYEFHNAK